jgi:hypothetical protein
MGDGPGPRRIVPRAPRATRRLEPKIIISYRGPLCLTSGLRCLEPHVPQDVWNPPFLLFHAPKPPPSPTSLSLFPLLQLEEAVGANTCDSMPHRTSTPAKAANRCMPPPYISLVTPPPQEPTKSSIFDVFPTVGALCGLETSPSIRHCR